MYVAKFLICHGWPNSKWDSNLESRYNGEKQNSKGNINFQREMICLQHFYNIFTTNPKWQVITSCYGWGKQVILVLVSNLNQ